MSKSETPKTKRILLKLSGEALMGDNAFGISRDTLKSIVGEIKEVVDLGVQLAIVVGGGNIFRGVALGYTLSLIHIYEPTRQSYNAFAVFCL